MNRYAHATYCDDIRHEQHGKLTLVGVYNSSLLVASLPAVLPKLCLILNVVTPADKPFERLKIRILMNETLLAEGELSEEDVQVAIASIPAADDDAPDAEQRHLFTAHFVFSPIHLEGPGAIRVRIETEEGEMKANALRIAQAAEAAVDPA